MKIIWVCKICLFKLLFAITYNVPVCYILEYRWQPDWDKRKRLCQQVRTGQTTPGATAKEPVRLSSPF